MPPKKKIKKADSKHVEERNEAECSKSELSITNTENTSIGLSSLPADVLFYIYKFLSPADLVSISQLGDPKFREVANFQRELNFSVCWRAGVELLSSYFSRENVKYIQKMNFNSYVSARPCDLVQVICKCKNLVNLSIIECGIQYNQILKILKTCSALKELSWSIKKPLEVERDCHSSVTKLFLLLDVGTRTIGTSEILNNFPKIERAIICCSSGTLTIPPLIAPWSKSFRISSNDNLKWITVISDTICLCEKKLVPSSITPLIYGIKKYLEVPSLFAQKATLHENDLYYDRPPSLKIMCREQDISSLSASDSRTYSNVIICLTSESFDVHERLFNCVSKVTGSKLKHLSIECADDDVIFNLQSPFMQPVLYQTISNLLGTLLLNCKNITALNFGAVHFSCGSPFKAMCSLKNLKFLNMPTCAFPKNLPNSSKLCNQQVQDECSSFEELVSKCSSVEEFHLVCCCADKGKMQDSEIFPIENWKKLISFTIYSVIFYSCRFLRKIADSCSEFQSFEFIASAKNSSCIFYEDVIYLLTHAKNLSFLRINCSNFNPQFERFLTAVSLAKNLQGICILTNVKTFINSADIITSINSLKYLHLFHFHAPRVSERLYTEVRKSMERNNIKTCNVKSYLFSTDFEMDVREAYQRHGEISKFYHLKPSFKCEHLHFKKYLFDSCTYFDAMW